MPGFIIRNLGVVLDRMLVWVDNETYIRKRTYSSAAHILRAMACKT